MADIRLIVDLVLAVGVAFIGGAIAQRLGQPVILGYLLAGLAIGPFTPGPTADAHSIEILAEMGVAFLMFALGAEVSIEELRRLGRVSFLGGPLQILGTMVLGVALGPMLGLTFTQGVYLGGLLALSSTVVVLKVLMGRGELQTLHGRASLGILIAQDLAVVPMVIILPAIASGSDQLPIALATAGAKVIAVLIAVYLIGARITPWLLEHAALSRTRELFLLSVVVLALGTAVATHAVGLSLAFGAFLAGLVVAESEYRTQVIAEVLPFRDLFAALFFVSIGMLINPMAMASDPGLIILVTVAVVLGKIVIGTGVLLLVGVTGPAALLTGLAIAQVGEFSFVLARIGVSEGVIPAPLFDLTLAVALLSIVLTPSLLRMAPAIQRVMERVPLIGPRIRVPLEPGHVGEGAGDHVIICGYGRVGKELGDELDLRGEPYVVIEYNPPIVQDLRRQGKTVVYGDAGNPVVLDHANVAGARLLAVLVPDILTAELATRNARRMNPELDIIARATRADDVRALWRAGASEVVQPEFEAGVEVIRHTLFRYGVDAGAVELRLSTRRQAYYGGGLTLGWRLPGESRVEETVLAPVLTQVDKDPPN